MRQKNLSVCVLLLLLLLLATKFVLTHNLLSIAMRIAHQLD